MRIDVARCRDCLRRQLRNLTVRRVGLATLEFAAKAEVGVIPLALTTEGSAGSAFRSSLRRLRELEGRGFSPAIHHASIIRGFNP